MKKISISKMDEVAMAKAMRGAAITAKTLLGLFALGVCLKGGQCVQHAAKKHKEAMKAQEAADSKIYATLIDKAYSPATGTCFCYLDLDGKPGTDAVAKCGMTLKEVGQFHDMTNGTIKSVAEWKKMTSLPQDFAYTK